MQKILIDVQDRDGEWFLGVEVYCDGSGVLWFPRESAERLGEEVGGMFYLTAWDVEADFDPIVTEDGAEVEAWLVWPSFLTTRPAKGGR